MFPAIHLFGIHISMYALMTFLGVVAYFVCYFIFVEKKEKVDRGTSNRLLLVSLAGLASLYVFAFLLNSLYHSIEKGEVVMGGITWLGGIMFAIPIMILLIHFIVPKAKGRAVELCSLMIPGIAIGHALGRLGCFFAGCCFGKVTDGPFGISFPEGSTAAKLYPAAGGGSLPVYPTQLFEAAFEVAIFLFMVIGYKKWKKFNVPIYMIGYSVFRFLLEFLRGDDRGLLGSALSPSQWNAIIFLALGVAVLLYLLEITPNKIKSACKAWQEAADKIPVEPLKKNGEVDNAAVLSDLKRLRDEGVLTEEEYAAKKEEVLKRM